MLPGVPSDFEAAVKSDGAARGATIGALSKASSKLTTAFLHDQSKLLSIWDFGRKLVYRAQCMLKSDSWQSACVVHVTRHHLVLSARTCLVSEHSYKQEMC